MQSKTKLRHSRQSCSIPSVNLYFPRSNRPGGRFSRSKSLRELLSAAMKAQPKTVAPKPSKQTANIFSRAASRIARLFGRKK